MHKNCEVEHPMQSKKKTATSRNLTTLKVHLPKLHWFLAITLLLCQKSFSSPFESINPSPVSCIDLFLHLI